MVKRRVRSSYDDYYDDISRYGRPLKTEDGIKAKSVRGTFGESWWAKRWIATLEGYGIGSRLQRGRSYARAGQVLDMHIEPGTITARVQGSMPRPYRVNIGLPMLSDTEWDHVIDAMGAQAIFAAKLLAGEMPNEIEEAFKTAHVSLFPAQGRELKTSCSCPDAANPCKHIAAVYYLLGEQFDADPFLIFTLRGRSRDQVIAELRKRRQSAVPEQESGAADVVEPAALTLPLTDGVTENFWGGGDFEAVNVLIEAAPIKFAVLKRLGNPPHETQAALQEIYTRMSEAALNKALEDADS